MGKTEFSSGKKLLAISISLLLVALTACSTPTPTPTPTPKPTTPAATTPAATTPAASASPTYAPWTGVPVQPATPTGPALKGLPKLLFNGTMTAPKTGNFPGAPGATSINVFCQVEFTNMYIVKSSTTNVEGQGHVVFYLDMDPITTKGAIADKMPSPAPSSKAKLFVADQQANIISTTISTGATYTFSKVSGGAHTVAAQLVQNDGTPFDPPIVYSTVKITGVVATPSPSPSPAK